jgi:hypothetical protein
MLIAIVPTGSTLTRIRHLLPYFAAMLLVTACATSGAMLNSDLIERRYGSYAVEIRDADAERRIVSLYSGPADQPTTRTYAITEFLNPDRPAYRDQHEQIVGGSSIGSTFRAAGYDLRKQSLFIGELEVPPAYSTLGDLMNIELPAMLAVHQYLLVVSKDENAWSYARITEIHHPDFLTVGELQAMYGEIVFDDSNRDSIHDFAGPPPGK